MDGRALARQLAELVERLHEAPDPLQTAEEVVAFAVEQLKADFAGITLIKDDGRLETVAPTSPLAEEVDRLQYELHEGPCHDSAWHGGTYASEDLAAETRWPLWAPKAAALGVGSVLGAELVNQARDHRLGAVNLFWRRARAFGPEDVSIAQLITRHAALALDASLTVEGLNLALDVRKLVGQAQGMLMERHGLTEDQAFAALRRYAATSKLTLRELAEQVVATRRFPDENGSGGRVLDDAPSS